MKRAKDSIRACIATRTGENFNYGETGWAWTNFRGDWIFLPDSRKVVVDEFGVVCSLYKAIRDELYFGVMNHLIP